MNIVITNNKPRTLLMWTELPEGIGASEFDYVEDRYAPRFFKYRGDWYDVFEFEHISDQPCYAPLCGKWGAVQSDSYFTGVVIKWHRHFDSIIVGRYSE